MTKIEEWCISPIVTPLNCFFYRFILIISVLNMIMDLLTGRWWNALVNLYYRAL